MVRHYTPKKLRVVGVARRDELVALRLDRGLAERDAWRLDDYPREHGAACRKQVEAAAAGIIADNLADNLAEKKERLRVPKAEETSKR